MSRLANQPKNSPSIAKNVVNKLKFSPISKTLIIFNALMAMLFLSTLKTIVTFFLTKKIKTNYSKHLKDAIRVWQKH